MILTSVYFVFKLIKDIYILVFSFFIVFYKQKTVIPISYLPTMDFFKTAIKKKWDTKFNNVRKINNWLWNYDIIYNQFNS